MRVKAVLLLTGLFLTNIAHTQPSNSPAAVTHLEKFNLRPPPLPGGLLLRSNDRLAICGDSITEQKMYSRIMEDYLTVCVPELKITVRQYGWGGEKASGFLARMTNDCLRFKPTIATTCYGMNDHEYRPYEDRIGQVYRSNSTAIVQSFTAHGARVIQGSPGCVGKVPGWAKRTNDTIDDLNLNLARLRDIGVEIAEKEHVGFADVFWPMLNGGVAAQKRFGQSYAIAGADGVHPGWAGHTVMAYAFLKAFGLDGDLGTFTVDLAKNEMTASKGHEIISSKDGEYVVKSSRYPFCGCVPAPKEGKSSYPVCDSDNPEKDTSIQSALMAIVPFNRDLSRFWLTARGGKAKDYTVSWGSQSRKFSVSLLARGINLTAEFPISPFAEAFSKVDAAVAAKQAYETKQIKQVFRSKEAREDMEGVVAQTEKERDALAAAIQAAFIPVTHTIKIVAGE